MTLVSVVLGSMMSLVSVVLGSMMTLVSVVLESLVLESTIVSLAVLDIVSDVKYANVADIDD